MNDAELIRAACRLVLILCGVLLSDRRGNQVSET